MLEDVIFLKNPEDGLTHTFYDAGKKLNGTPVYATLGCCDLVVYVRANKETLRFEGKTADFSQDLTGEVTCLKCAASNPEKWEEGYE